MVKSYKKLVEIFPSLGGKSSYTGALGAGSVGTGFINIAAASLPTNKLTLTASLILRTGLL